MVSTTIIAGALRRPLIRRMIKQLKEFYPEVKDKETKEFGQSIFEVEGSELAIRVLNNSVSCFI